MKLPLFDTHGRSSCKIHCADLIKCMLHDLKAWHLYQAKQWKLSVYISFCFNGHIWGMIQMTVSAQEDT